MRVTEWTGSGATCLVCSSLGSRYRKWLIRGRGRLTCHRRKYIFAINELPPEALGLCSRKAGRYLKGGGTRSTASKASVRLGGPVRTHSGSSFGTLIPTSAPAPFFNQIGLSVGDEKTRGSLRPTQGEKGDAFCGERSPAKARRFSLFRARRGRPIDHPTLNDRRLGTDGVEVILASEN